MSGIVFYQTDQLDRLIEFYTGTISATVWLEQPDCTILDYDGFRFGFCERDSVDDCGILTFVFEDRAGVDAIYERVSDLAQEEPHENEKYEIYQFFAEDPDGRMIEFQTFLHELP